MPVVLITAFCLLTPTAATTEPQLLWNATIGAQILQSNGVYLSPDEESLIVTAKDCTITSFESRTGVLEWTYVPPAMAGEALQCSSGIAFTTPNADETYMVYSLVDTSLKQLGGSA